MLKLRPVQDLARSPLPQFADHIAEQMETPTASRVWFQADTSNSSRRSIEVPAFAPLVDYGSRAGRCDWKKGSADFSRDAASNVFGYWSENDVTERMCSIARPVEFGVKSFDNHAPIGPWITTSDEVPDPHQLGLRRHVSTATTRQTSNTSHLCLQHMGTDRAPVSGDDALDG